MKSIVLTFWLLLLGMTPLFALTIEGTGDSETLLTALAAAYQEGSPQRQVKVPRSVGSSGGVRLLLKGRTDLARIARPLRRSESEQDLHSRQFAVVPVVFAANLPEGCLSSLNTGQVIKIFRGELTRWSQLGDCPDRKIYLARREAGDSSNRILHQQITGLSQIERPVGQVIYTTPSTLKTLRGQPYSLGYLPLSATRKSGLSVLAFNGIQPTPAAILKKEYALQLPLSLAWRTAPTVEAQAFLDYLESAAARKIIADFGSIPVYSRSSVD